MLVWMWPPPAETDGISLGGLSIETMEQGLGGDCS
jgi:hypothetical protein